MNTSIIQKSLRLINRYNSLTKKARHYGMPFLLYPSEIHMIEVIGSEDELTTTKLAEILGITKGGVSQITAKLLEKGLIIKKEQTGSNTVFITLSDNGQTAFIEHRKFHEKMLSDIDSITDSFSEETINAIQLLIDTIENELNRIETEYET